MPTINIFKIDNNEIDNCLKKLSEDNPQQITIDNESNYELNLYIYDNHKDTDEIVPWSWILSEFGEMPIPNIKKAKAVLLIKTNKTDEENNTYALSFGNAFFLVDKFCDRNFALDFVARIDLKGVKNSTLKSPNTIRDKTIYTYINYEDLDVSSGDSVAKLKLKVKLKENFTLFKPTIEIGNSIKLNLPDATIKTIIECIEHIETTIRDNEIKQKLPVFVQIKNKQKLELLNNEFYNSLEKVLINKTETSKIIIPELEIIGTDEIINNNSDEYEIKYKRKSPKKITNLNIEDLIQFCSENEITNIEEIKKIKIIKILENGNKNPKDLFNFIEYTNEKEQSIFSNGHWYYYNKFYLDYLNNSVSSINSIYNEKYDFDYIQKDNLIKEFYKRNKNDKIEARIIELYENKYPDLLNYSEDEKKQKIKKSYKDEELEEKAFNMYQKTYYKEFAFNNLICEQEKYELFDRKDAKIYEKMDIYDKEEKIMYAVKFGNASSGLSYAITQSITSLKEYKNKRPDDFPEIEKVGLWFVLERKTHLPLLEDGKVDLTKLKMLMLFNELDYWRKEVILNNFQPIIHINYYSKE